MQGSTKVRPAGQPKLVAGRTCVTCCGPGSGPRARLGQTWPVKRIIIIDDNRNIDLKDLTQQIWTKNLLKTPNFDVNDVKQTNFDFFCPLKP